MPDDVLNQIRELLRSAGIAFREVQHEPTHTSAESAAARGEELRNGGKALLMKVGDTFRLFVLSAACQLDSGAIKRHFGVKRQRFATLEELQALTGLTPGAVPPFGRPVLPFDLFVDTSILEKRANRVQCRVADELDHPERGRLPARGAAHGFRLQPVSRALRRRDRRLRLARANPLLPGAGPPPGWSLGRVRRGSPPAWDRTSAAVPRGSPSRAERF